MDEAIRSRARNIRALFFDLDGTLLTPQRTITPATVSALREAQDRGYFVAFATGRSLTTLGLFTERFGFQPNAPSVGCGGGEVGEVGYARAAERLELHPIPNDTLLRLFRFLSDANIDFSTDGCGPVYMSGHFSNFETYARDFAAAEACGAAMPPLVRLGADELSRAADGTVLKAMAWFDRPAQLEPLRGFLESETGLACFSSGFSMLELTAAGVDKARGVATAAAALGLTPAQCCVFGDSGNDVPMLRAAGLSVAVENASPDAKASASLICGRNDADGPARAVRELFLGG